MCVCPRVCVRVSLTVPVSLCARGVRDMQLVPSKKLPVTKTASLDRGVTTRAHACKPFPLRHLRVGQDRDLGHLEQNGGEKLHCGRQR